MEELFDLNKKVERESAYELCDELRSKLLAVLNETEEATSRYKFEECDISRSQAVYLKNCNDFSTGIDEGLCARHSMQKKKVKEQPRLSARTKNYLIKYYENGILRRIDSYVDGEFDLYYAAQYSEGRRYLFPITQNGEHYYTYTHVLCENGNICEEYLANNNQIVLYRYEKLDDTRYSFLNINYIPNGAYPVNSIETGVFEVTDTISYTPDKHYTWYDEFDSQRKGISFEKPDIPYLVSYK